MLVSVTTKRYQFPTVVVTMPKLVSLSAPPLRSCSRSDQLVAVCGINRKVSNPTPALLFNPLLLELRMPSWTLLPLVWPFALIRTDIVRDAPLVEKSQLLLL